VRAVATLLVPYHLDEHLPPIAALVPDADVVMTESMPGDTAWARYGALHELVAGHRPPGWPVPAGLREVEESRLVLVGARDVDPPEVEYLRESAIRQVGVGELTGESVPDGPLLLHIDLDVVDAAALPGLRYPVTPGPSPAEVVAAARRVLATGRVVALEVAATWFPIADPPAGRALVDELLAS